VIQAYVDGVDVVKLALKAKGPKAQAAILRETWALGLKLQLLVKEGKLTGQVLKVQTNRLRGSISLRVIEGSAAVFAAVGTNVEYGRAWELGFTVKPYLHANLFGKGIKANMPGRTVPARPFLRPTLTEMTPEIKVRLKAAAAAGLK
jgi:phage gpG-like protein